MGRDMRSGAQAGSSTALDSSSFIRIAMKRHLCVDIQERTHITLLLARACTVSGRCGSTSSMVAWSQLLIVIRQFRAHDLLYCGVCGLTTA